MRVHILDPHRIRPDVDPSQLLSHEQLLADVPKDAHGRHKTTDDPQEADVILAVSQRGTFGPFFRDLRASAFFRAHERKIVGYCPEDLVHPSIPGIYPAATPFWARRGQACGGHYVSSHIHVHEFEIGPPEGRDILFSFVGTARTHPLRSQLLQLRHPHALLSDATPGAGDKNWWDNPENARRRFEEFRITMGRTRFALCPRGISASSIRLFEAMQAGCVPVIVADDLVLPEGPDWASFALRIPEARVASIPAQVEAANARFADMSHRARTAWEQWFSPESTFHSFAEWSLALLDRRSKLRVGRRLKAMALATELLGRRNARANLKDLPRRLEATARLRLGGWREGSG